MMRSECEIFRILLKLVGDRLSVHFSISLTVPLNVVFITNDCRTFITSQYVWKMLYSRFSSITRFGVSFTVNQTLVSNLIDFLEKPL